MSSTRLQATISNSGQITLELSALRTVRVGAARRFLRAIYSKEELLMSAIATEYLETLREAMQDSIEPIHRLDCVIELSAYESPRSARQLHLLVQVETTTAVAVVESQARTALTAAPLLVALSRAGLYRTHLTARCYTACDRMP